MKLYRRRCVQLPQLLQQYSYLWVGNAHWQLCRRNVCHSECDILSSDRAAALLQKASTVCHDRVWPAILIAHYIVMATTCRCDVSVIVAELIIVFIPVLTWASVPAADIGRPLYTSHFV